RRSHRATARPARPAAEDLRPRSGRGTRRTRPAAPARVGRRNPALVGAAEAAIRSGGQSRLPPLLHTPCNRRVLAAEAASTGSHIDVPAPLPRPRRPAPRPARLRALVPLPA